MITIIHYGLGNILAFANVYKRLGIEVKVAENADDLKDAGRIILPGVGSFDHAMELLEESGMRETLDEKVLGQRVPVLGVCVGMQIMANLSQEGKRAGLGWIDGDVRMLCADGGSNRLILPHMGWNDVEPVEGSALFEGLETASRFYFLHSFGFHCNDGNTLATSEYGTRFVSAVHKDNVFGVQFHPEKSHHYGSRLLQNFARI